MKLRDYVRGLGTGILVTALILGRLIGAGRPLTDAEIRAKALTLGMVDANSISLSDVGGNDDGAHAQSGTSLQTGSPEPEETPTQTEQGPSSSPEGDESPEPDMTGNPDESEDSRTNPGVTDSPEPVDTPTPSPTLSPSPSPASSTTTPPSSSLGTAAPQDPDTVETVTVVISRGDSSYTVCRKLEEAGLVENAQEFDNYLTDNGYSRTIRTGTYKIPVGSSWEEIVDIIA